MNCGKCGATNTDDAAFCKVCGNSLRVSGPTPAASPTSGPSQMGGMNMRITNAFKNAIDLVKNPVAFMKQNKDVVPPVNSTMINYVAVLAAIPFFATLIGDLWYYSFFRFFGFAGGFFGYAIAHAIVTYILDVAAVFVVGFVIWKLAPSFGTTTDQAKSTLLAAYVYTPVFLISILNIIPFIGWITVLGLLYGLYILYLGLPILLNTPADRVIIYVVAILVAAFVVYAIIGTITALIFFGSFFFL
ncbi:MAG: zinc ribbon domain-containing protein [Thaumarchaeota archaeon]|nr:zinc ribbon domain-containing protein [Nitrososphaerota archaeon]